MGYHVENMPENPTHAATWINLLIKAGWLGFNNAFNIIYVKLRF